MLKLKLLLSMVLLASVTCAYEADDVRITKVESMNPYGHIYFSISAPNNCTNPHSYFIVQRWDDRAEPTKTQRLMVYQIAVLG
jgi:hypothetical protein